MSAERIPGLDTLKQAPRIFETMLAGAGKETLDWKSNPERWSIGEVLVHLAHVEREGFRAAHSSGAPATRSWARSACAR